LKEALMHGVFDAVASKDGITNDAMSLVIFVASGRARALHRRRGRNGRHRSPHTRLARETRVDVVDINGEMLSEGFKRFKKTMYHNSAPACPHVSFFFSLRTNG
jgi:hypothetical protein